MNQFDQFVVFLHDMHTKIETLEKEVSSKNKHDITFDISEQSQLKGLLTDVIQHYNYMKVKMFVNGTDVSDIDRKIWRAEDFLDKLDNRGIYQQK